MTPPCSGKESVKMMTLVAWRTAMQPPQVVAFFDGLFERAGVRVTDTGEAFTCRHLGDRIEFESGIDDAAVDFTVDIESAQAERIVAFVGDGALDEREQFRIMAVLASPATQAALRRPIIKSRLLRSVLYRIGRAERRMQVVLVAPPGESDEMHTIAYEAGEWVVTAGRHGSVPHVYRLTVADAVEYQRKMLAARKANSLRSWIRFARWYGQLRRRVVVPA
jgi:hypothetical protein